MLRNLIIILMSIVIVFWCFYVLYKRNYFSASCNKIIILLGLLWLLTTFLPNISIMLAPLTPPIKGIVIDEDTKHPISNCNIKAYWNVETYSLVGAHMEAYHSFHTNTNARGSFEIPRHQKVLGLYGFVPLILLNRYAGMHLVIYDYEHKYKLIGLDKNDLVWTSQSVYEQNIQTVRNAIILKIKKQNDTVSYLENILELASQILYNKNYQEKITDNDLRFIFGSFDRIDRDYTAFDCNLYEKGTLDRYSKLMEELGDIDRSIKVREMGRMTCPKETAYENKEIVRLKQLLNINKKKGGL